VDNIQPQLQDALSIFGNACIEKQEILDGYVYTLISADEVLDSILSLVKTIRRNHPYLKFEFSVQDIRSNMRLKITGPEGTKDILLQEIDII
jgi:hypothetical protein